MSDKHDDKSAVNDIPKVLVDAKHGQSYQRLRFFGKVIHILDISFCRNLP